MHSLSRLLLLLLFHFAAATPARRSYDTHNYYVVRHNPRLPSAPPLSEVTRTLGVELVERAGELEDHWLVRQEKPPGNLVARASMDPVVETYENLRRRAYSSDSLERRSDDDADSDHARRFVETVDWISPQTLRQRSKRAPPTVKPPTAAAQVAQRLGFQDPLFPEQWHLVNDANPEHMMNVVPVWEMGFTGKGIISSLVDDGLDYQHEDLADNFDAVDSHDFNDHVDLPTPKNGDDHHGTRCAGQVAAIKNKSCGVGIAYDSKVAGVRILSGPISDVDEAAALNYGFQNVSIYSCSWGPPDNGMSMEGPNYLIKKAVLNGINNGRGGKGSIFVFASGNGAASGDQCNFDGYTNSIYSVTVSAIDYKGLHPYYSESCAANMIVAYSSGSGKSIVTTDKGNGTCTHGHGGTSAAAPNAVGVFALALQARPDLTWRDIQHLCVETARIVNPDDADWEPTATGRKYSYKYGYGALDGEKYVKAAQAWKLVKPQAWVETDTVIHDNGVFDSKENKYSGGKPIGNRGIESKLTITEDMLKESNFEKLEHINVKVWIDHTKRGDVEVEIISPNGITSVLAGRREGDNDKTGYPGWIFMSVKHWGENPVGEWVLKIRDQQTVGHSGSFLGWNMVLWGSTIDPALARKYEVPLVEDALPPPPIVHPPHTPSTTTKQLTKPTKLLPSDHAKATGENSKPAFSSTTPTPAASPSISGTADIGWFSDLGKLVTSQKWFFGAVGFVACVGAAFAVYFWRRRLSHLRTAAYTSLRGDDDVRMAALGGASMTPVQRTTRDLYDAFGEVSDDDDDADENTALHGPAGRRDLGFHSGFLDDDDPSTAGGSGPAQYRDDEPPSQRSGALNVPAERESGSSSPTDGSWSHASRE